MINSLSSCRTNRRDRIVAACALVASLAFACDLTAVPVNVTGRVTLDNAPLRSALVKVESPDQTVVTRTDADGRFIAAGILETKAAFSVTVSGRLVYLKIVEVGSEPLSIELLSAGRIASGGSFAAIAAADSDTLYFADDYGRVFRNRDGNATEIATTQYVSDLAVSQAGGKTTVLVATGGQICRVLELAPDGRQMNAWSVGAGSCAGIVVDTASGAVYVANAKESSVYRRAANGKGTKLIARMMLRQIGPIAFDPQRAILFIADSMDGRIFAVQQPANSTRTFAHGLGEIRAMAVDNSRDRLYAADVSRKCIWQFDLTSPQPKAMKFASAGAVKEPRGLAVASNGTVWVGDAGVRGLLAFSPDGELLQNLFSK